MSWVLVDETTDLSVDKSVSDGIVTDEKVLYRVDIDAEVSSGGIGFRLSGIASGYWLGSFYYNKSNIQGNQYADSSRFKASYIIRIRKKPTNYGIEVYARRVWFDRDSNKNSLPNYNYGNDFYNNITFTSFSSFELFNEGAGSFLSGTMKLFKRELQ